MDGFGQQSSDEDNLGPHMLMQKEISAAVKQAKKKKNLEQDNNKNRESALNSQNSQTEDN